MSKSKLKLTFLFSAFCNQVILSGLILIISISSSCINSKSDNKDSQAQYNKIEVQGNWLLLVTNNAYCNSCATLMLKENTGTVRMQTGEETHFEYLICNDTLRMISKDSVLNNFFYDDINFKFKILKLNNASSKLNLISIVKGNKFTLFKKR